jgi:iron-sulfur cluster repair protein YtfE (RIC family)
MREVLSPRALAECEPRWQMRPVSSLTTHISGIYHERMRDELPVLTRQATELSKRFGDVRAFHLHALAGLLRELRDQVDSHAWTEEDLLFPVLAARDHPTILITTLTPDRLLRLVDELSQDHVHIREMLGRITAHIAAVSDLAAVVPEWAELLERVTRLRDYKLEELDLEDRCVLPRAREYAAADRLSELYR